MASTSHSGQGCLRLRARLRRAGWLEAKDGKNSGQEETVWTPRGLQRAILLRDVIESHGLDEAGISLAQFTREALKLRRRVMKQRAGIAAKFWAYCVVELGMRHDLDEEGLRHLVDLVLQAHRSIDPFD